MEKFILEPEVPEDVLLSLRSHGFSKEDLLVESRFLLALKFFREGMLSLGKAAKLAGLSRWDFIELLGKRGISVIDYSIEELEEEFKLATELAQRL